MSRVFETRGFCHGFTWGTGQGTDFCTRQKPVPVARVHGFDPSSNSARKRERLPAQHTFPPTITTNYHENSSRIAKEEEWVVHPPISLEGMLSIGQDYVLIMTNSKLCRFPVVPHIPPPSKRARVPSFLMMVDCSSAPPSHHPRKRARMLVFDGGGMYFITTIPLPLKTSTHARF